MVPLGAGITTVFLLAGLKDMLSMRSNRKKTQFLMKGRVSSIVVFSKPLYPCASLGNCGIAGIILC